MSNPVLNENFVNQERVLDGEPMTINGAINKSLILLALVIVPAIYTWSLVFQGFMDKAMMLGTIGAIIGFILAMIICFARKGIPVLAPLYAVCEGLFVGGISALFENQYSGIVMQAVGGTFACAAVMLVLYRFRVIQNTEKFRAVIFTATASVALIYLIQIIASFFGRSIPQIFTSSPIGIGFSIIVVAIASFNLISDCDFIERGSENFLPKEYEWFGAFGLTVTIVWLYIEVLKLVAKLRDNN